MGEMMSEIRSEKELKSGAIFSKQNSSTNFGIEDYFMWMIILVTGYLLGLISSSYL